MVNIDTVLKAGGVLLLAAVALAVLGTVVSIAIWAIETAITLAAIVVLLYLGYLLLGYLTGGSSDRSRPRSRDRDRDRDRIFER
ncbi:hypothetical protein [Halalkalicoccus tibetensis]|uniref:Uncharacterized protein n=1 Tax=Halalkalicoccus tibetensis TaxID=175632 RepID=A0ABD5V8C7_9EURY